MTFDGNLLSIKGEKPGTLHLPAFGGRWEPACTTGSEPSLWMEVDPWTMLHGDAAPRFTAAPMLCQTCQNKAAEYWCYAVSHARKRMDSIAKGE